MFKVFLFDPSVNLEKAYSDLSEGKSPYVRELTTSQEFSEANLQLASKEIKGELLLCNSGIVTLKVPMMFEDTKLYQAIYCDLWGFFDTFPDTVRAFSNNGTEKLVIDKSNTVGITAYSIDNKIDKLYADPNIVCLSWNDNLN